jgi:hypothetical protein
MTGAIVASYLGVFILGVIIRPLLVRIANTELDDIKKDYNAKIDKLTADVEKLKLK